MTYNREWNTNTKVYIGNLGQDAKEDTIKGFFQRYGRIQEIWVAKSSPGFAFVEFIDSRDAEAAARSLNGTRICDARNMVEMTTGKPILSSRAAKKLETTHSGFAKEFYPSSDIHKSSSSSTACSQPSTSHSSSSSLLKGSSDLKKYSPVSSISSYERLKSLNNQKDQSSSRFSSSSSSKTSSHSQSYTDYDSSHFRPRTSRYRTDDREMVPMERDRSRRRTPYAPYRDKIENSNSRRFFSRNYDDIDVRYERRPEYIRNDRYYESEYHEDSSYRANDRYHDYNHDGSVKSHSHRHNSSHYYESDRYEEYQLKNDDWHSSYRERRRDSRSSYGPIASRGYRK